MAKPLQLVFDKLLKKEWRRVLIRRASLRRDGRVLSTISLNTEKGGDDFGSTVSLKKGMTSSGLLSTSFLQLVIRLLQRLASEIKSFASCRRTCNLCIHPPCCFATSLFAPASSFSACSAGLYFQTSDRKSSTSACMIESASCKHTQ